MSGTTKRWRVFGNETRIQDTNYRAGLCLKIRRSIQPYKQAMSSSKQHIILYVYMYIMSSQTSKRTAFFLSGPNILPKTLRLFCCSRCHRLFTAAERSSERCVAVPVSGHPPRFFLVTQLDFQDQEIPWIEGFYGTSQPWGSFFAGNCSHFLLGGCLGKPEMTQKTRC